MCTLFPLSLRLIRPPAAAGPGQYGPPQAVPAAPLTRPAIGRARTAARAWRDVCARPRARRQLALSRGDRWQPSRPRPSHRRGVSLSSRSSSPAPSRTTTTCSSAPSLADTSAERLARRSEGPSARDTEPKRTTRSPTCRPDACAGPPGATSSTTAHARGGAEGAAAALIAFCTHEGAAASGFGAGCSAASRLGGAGMAYSSCILVSMTRMSSVWSVLSRACWLRSVRVACTSTSARG
mmetsp:Transcript_5701/g.19398  ORF Transcript_5701/g.19398 Transcript_5701/m.19398 type:complete len:238 (-) Transcript_5701:180-893(-)